MYSYGNHDYNKTPLAPLGCKTQCFVGPDNRTSFGEHSIDSWYIGTSIEHYRSHRVFVKETSAERVTDALVFMHRHITNPVVSKADQITVAAKELTNAIRGNLKDDISKMNMKELERLAEIFEKAAKKVSEDNASASAPRVQTSSAAAPRVPEATTMDLDDIPPLRYVTDDEDSDSDDEDEDAPTPRVARADTDKEPVRRYNLRSNTRGNIMTDVMLSVIELSNTKLTPNRLSGRQFPMQFLCEVAGAVMNEDTGDMLEYRHLVKIPKY
jgi:hypothetical protein